MCKVGLLFIGTITMSFGFSQFIEVYAHNLIGWVSSVIYLFILAKTYHEFLNRMVMIVLWKYKFKLEVYI